MILAQYSMGRRDLTQKLKEKSFEATLMRQQEAAQGHIHQKKLGTGLYTPLWERLG